MLTLVLAAFVISGKPQVPIFWDWLDLVPVGQKTSVRVWIELETPWPAENDHYTTASLLMSDCLYSFNHCFFFFFHSQATRRMQHFVTLVFVVSISPSQTFFQQWPWHHLSSHPQERTAREGSRIPSSSSKVMRLRGKKKILNCLLLWTSDLLSLLCYPW